MRTPSSLCPLPPTRANHHYPRSRRRSAVSTDSDAFLESNPPPPSLNASPPSPNPTAPNYTPYPQLSAPPRAPTQRGPHAPATRTAHTPTIHNMVHPTCRSAWSDGRVPCPPTAPTPPTHPPPPFRRRHCLPLHTGAMRGVRQRRDITRVDVLSCIYGPVQNKAATATCCALCGGERWPPPSARRPRYGRASRPAVRARSQVLTCGVGVTCGVCHTCTHTHTHTHTHTQRARAHTRARTCTHTCMRIRARTRARTHARTDARAHANACTHTHTTQWCRQCVKACAPGAPQA